MKKTLPFLLSTILLINILSASAQDEKKYQVACIGFYNLENLFDIKDDADVNDEEYTPESDKNWNETRYQKKLESLSEVISQIGKDLTPDGPAVLGLCEVENKGVVEDLIATETLKKFDFGIVHYDSPDRRGVDVALIYQKKYFKVTNSAKYILNVDFVDDFRTRNQLLVSGELNGEPMHFIVNHWPSRRGGEKRSKPLRNAAADLCRSIVDSILTTDKDAKVFVMGDLNDDPTDESVKIHMKAVGKPEKVVEGTMYNPMIEIAKTGIGSLAYQDSWNLFDQIIMTPKVLDKESGGYFFHKAKIYNKKFLTQQEGRFKGYPWRTYVGNEYQGGYSDHFPAYIYLLKEIK